MSNPIDILKREQLSQFLPTDRLIRAFESLFQSVGNSIPSDYEQAAIEAAIAVNTAQDALAKVYMLINSIDQYITTDTDSNIKNQTIDVLVPPLVIGTLGEQNATNAKITGGIITAQIKNNQTTALIESTVALVDGAAAATGTITNAPSAGNPTKWVPIIDDGVVRYIPAWQ